MKIGKSTGAAHILVLDATGKVRSGTARPVRNAVSQGWGWTRMAWRLCGIERRYEKPLVIGKDLSCMDVLPEVHEAVGEYSTP